MDAMFVWMKRKGSGLARPRAPVWLRAGAPRAMCGALRRTLAALACLAGSGVVTLACARPYLPAPPPQLPAAPLAAPGPPNAPNPPVEPPRAVPRGFWRNLSPAQRQAIRELSREQREALAGRQGLRPDGANAPGARLTPRERRELRDVIREEHERRGGGRFGPGKRP